MALKLGTLFVDIGLNTNPLKKSEKEISKTASKMGKTFSKLGPIIAAALSIQTVKTVVMLADSMNRLDQKIKNVARSGKEFTAVREGIRGIAMETGQSIESIATLSQQLLIAGEGVNATTADIVTMTSTLSKLGAIGGSSGEQMGNAMLQFGQAMAGGVMRAEEFNSIVENTPLIAKSIAQGMGLTTGELRKAVIAGDVLSKDVFGSLKSQADEINDKFKAMPITVDRAAGKIANAFAIAVQDVDSGLGVTQKIAEAMEDISKTIASNLVPAIDEIYLGFVRIGLMWEAVVGTTKDNNKELAKTTDEVGRSKAGFKEISDAIINLPANLKALFTIAIGEIDQAWLKAQASIDKYFVVIKAGFTKVFDEVKSSFLSFANTINSTFADIFSFFGADDTAEFFAENVKKVNEQQLLLTDSAVTNGLTRAEAAQLEIDVINEKLEIQLMASQAAIDMGIIETEATIEGVDSRIEALQREIDAKRAAAAEGKILAKAQADAAKKDALSDKQKQDAAKKADKAIEDAHKAKIQGLSDANSATNALNQAGIIDDKANAAVQIGIAAATAVAESTKVGFPAAIPFVAQALATIANARSMLSGSGRANGGSATAGLPIPINENGTPEMFINNAGRQFLLPDQSGSIVPLGGGGSGGGGGGMNVIINNNSDAVIGEPLVTQGQMTIEINNAVDRAVSQVNTSIASQRGETAEALRQGFLQTRNI